MGPRIVVSDSQESVHFMRYKKAENQLVIFCDETTPRYVTSVCLLDYDTLAVADRFGSVTIDEAVGIESRADPQFSVMAKLWVSPISVSQSGQKIERFDSRKL
ncbi:CPSF A subunit region domain-containing protein [Ditylenchus destructor]|nr:CPSF A subunit region domain-containing protein [Ditylenchus destructor]